MRALHERGFTQAQAARALHTSAYYVRKAGDEAGIIFDGTQTEAARAARASEVRAERDALAVGFRVAAREGLVMAMDRRLRPVDRKWAVTMAAIAADKDMALDDHGRRGRQLDREEEMDQQIAALTGIGSIFDAKDLEDEDFSDTDGMFPDDRDEPP
ncbi:hypothetical protein PQI66_04395 [Corynebacterium sp. USCH3]|uniref:hypothetical protein n=1 Tax=Corynebacterium sp. USCH3 TaxID=3024840 RepID=UPI0030981F21